MMRFGGFRFGGLGGVVDSRWTAGGLALAGIVLILVFLTGATVANQPDTADELSFVRIGTGSAAGTEFPIGGIIANAISSPPGAPPCDLGGSCGVPGLIAVAQSSLGTVENLERLAWGDLELAMVQSDLAHWAFAGTAPTAAGFAYGAPRFQRIRAIAHLYNQIFHVVVPADSDIKTVADLAGRRVSIGVEGSATLIDSRLLLNAYGMTEADIQARHLTADAAADALARGQLDGFVAVGGVPVLAVEDLARRMPVRLLHLDGAPVLQLAFQHPFFGTATVPEGVYDGVAQARTLAVGTVLVTDERLPDALVFEITRSLWHPRTQALLEIGHARGRDIRLENAMNNLSVPLHPGAERYYRSVGVPITAPRAGSADPS